MSRIRPLNLPLSIYFPNKRLVSLAVELKNVPGALMEDLAVIHRFGINIVGLLSNTATANSPTTSVVIHLDVSGVEEEKLQEMLEEIRRQEKTLSAHILDAGIHSFTADQYHNRILSLNARVVLMSEASLKGLLHSLYTTFGDAAAAAFLYHMGMGGGHAIARYEKQLFKDPRVCIRVIEHNAVAFGYAHRLTIREVGATMFELVFEGLFECEYLAGKKGPTSNWIRGMAAGFIEELFGGKWSATEVKCVNAGDGVCMFRVVRQ